MHIDTDTYIYIYKHKFTSQHNLAHHVLYHDVLTHKFSNGFEILEQANKLPYGPIFGNSKHKLLIIYMSIYVILITNLYFLLFIHDLKASYDESLHWKCTKQEKREYFDY